jgi:hypothetical protein
MHCESTGQICVVPIEFGISFFDQWYPSLVLRGGFGVIKNVATSASERVIEVWIVLINYLRLGRKPLIRAGVDKELTANMLD